VQLLLGLFGRGVIRQRTGKSKPVRFIAHSMCDNMNIFDRPIRRQESIFIIELLPLSGCAVVRRLHEGTIFWMSASKNHVNRNGRNLIVSKDTFLRPQDFSARDVPN
jgi:hypothetical protein